MKLAEVWKNNKKKSLALITIILDFHTFIKTQDTYSFITFQGHTTTLKFIYFLVRSNIVKTKSYLLFHSNATP